MTWLRLVALPNDLRLATRAHGINRSYDIPATLRSKLPLWSNCQNGQYMKTSSVTPNRSVFPEFSIASTAGEFHRPKKRLDWNKRFRSLRWLSFVNDRSIVDEAESAIEARTCSRSSWVLTLRTEECEVKEVSCSSGTRRYMIPAARNTARLECPASSALLSMRGRTV
jgi:hypothetical protein